MSDETQPAEIPDHEPVPTIEELVATMSEPEEGADPAPAEAAHEPAPVAAAPAPAEGEPIPPQEPAAAPEDPREARGLQMLAQREQELRAAQDAFRAEQEAIQADLDAFRNFQRKLQRDDALGALEDMGIKFDALSQSVLDGRGVNPVSQVEEQVTAKLTEAETRMQAQIDEMNRLRYERDMAEFRSGASAHISSSEDRLLADGFQDEATELVRGRYEALAEAQRHRGETVSLPPIEDVVRDLEKETLEFISRFKDNPRVRELFKQPARPQDAAPTLRNSHVASAPTRTTETDTDLFDPGDPRLFEALAKKHGY